MDPGAAARLEAVAVSFLFSFLNDAHERRVGALLRYVSETAVRSVYGVDPARLTATLSFNGL